MHFALPVAAPDPSGFTMDEMVEAAAEPGPLRLTKLVAFEEHMVAGKVK
jgi:hypothetical protein